MELWRRAAGVGTCRTHRGMELWSSGGTLQACRRGDVEVWRSGALEAAARVGTWRRRHRGIRALEMRCTREDVEDICSSGGVLRVY